jgi:hypothetical protein
LKSLRGGLAHETAEPSVHHLLLEKVMVQHVPFTAGTHQIANGIDDFTQVYLPLVVPGDLPPA